MAASVLGVKCWVGLAADVALDWLGAGRVNAHAGLALPVVVALSLQCSLPLSLTTVVPTLF